MRPIRRAYSSFCPSCTPSAALAIRPSDPNKSFNSANRRLAMHRNLPHLTLLVYLSPSLFAQAQATTEDLIKQVVAAFETKNKTALSKLAITEAEYRQYI